MDNVRLSFYDGLNRKLHIRNITSLDQLQGFYFTKIIEFISESKSNSFSVYLIQGRIELLHVTIRRSVDLEQLLKLGASLYANNKPGNDGKEY